MGNGVEILKEYTKEDNYVTKYKESGLNLTNNYKQIKIHTSQPCGFVKNEFDQENLLMLAHPHSMNLKCTPKVPEIQLNNSQIKDLRIEEKRNFELENCKLKSFMKDGNEQQEEPSEFHQEINNFQFFEQKNKCKLSSIKYGYILWTI